jgi:integrase
MKGPKYTQRADGRYQVSKTLGTRLDKAGRLVPNRVFGYGRTQQEARTDLQEKVREYERGLTRDSKQSVSTYLEGWLNTSVRPFKSENTVYQYEWAVNKWLTPELGATRLDKLRAQAVEALSAKMTRLGRRPKTINQVRTVLTIALEQAVKWGLLDRNPAAMTDPVPERRTAPAAWPKEAALRFLTAIEEHPYKTAYYLALGMGLRRGEILGLRWQDVDFDTATLRVTTTLKMVRGGTLLSTPKTAGSARTLAIPDFCVAALREQWAGQFNQSQSEYGLVFTDATGKPLSPPSLLSALLSIEAREGLPRLTLHQLRHTYGTLLTEHGIDILSVSRSMGHTDIATTSRYYVRTEDESRRRVAGAISDVLKNDR